MASFSTHITVSGFLGIGYTAAGHFVLGVPLQTSILGGCLCGIGGMLPDLDSDSGVPLRESLSFAAAVVPMLLADRLNRLGLPFETIVLAGAAVYLLVRFVLADLIKRYTVHRGMFHSLPAAVICGQCAFLLSVGEDIRWRIYQALAVILGYVSHLVLDEVFSIGLGGTGIRVKQSLGTALKLWGKSGWANLSTYGKLLILGFLIWQDPTVGPAIRDPRFKQDCAQALRAIGISSATATDTSLPDGAPVSREARRPDTVDGRWQAVDGRRHSVDGIR